MPKKLKAYVPVVKLKDMLLASVKIPGVTVVDREPELEMLTTGVPVIVRPVTIEVDQSVPPAAVHVIFPVPNAMVRVTAMLEVNVPVVSFFPFRSKVAAA